jgi:hypothetical protein
MWFPIMSSIPTLELIYKHLMLLSPPACLTARSHPPLILPPVPIDQRLAPRIMALWEVLHWMKESMPPTKDLIPYKHEDSIVTH